jgi:hypothetical protein
MVDALKQMGTTVDKDLQSLLAYYGEAADSTDAAKPEDFFALIMTFSSALNVRFCIKLFLTSRSDIMSQKAAIETLDAQPKIQVDNAPTTPVEAKTFENAVSTTVRIARTSADLVHYMRTYCLCVRFRTHIRRRTRLYFHRACPCSRPLRLHHKVVLRADSLSAVVTWIKQSAVSVMGASVGRGLPHDHLARYS